MSIKTRYHFIKKKHKNNLILFFENNRYFSYEEDLELLYDLHFYNRLEELQRRNINYIIFTNVTRIETFYSKENQYSKYCKALKIKKIILRLVDQK